jgi:hypothetical protein
MALHYQTECRVGNRRINRSYSGYQAFVAIFFDLIFGLTFELVSAVIGLAVRLFTLVVQVAARVLTVGIKALLAAMSVLVYVLTFPFMLLHEAVVRSGRSHMSWRRQEQPARFQKPDWALGREV